MKINQKNEKGVTVVSDYSGNQVKYGKVKAEGKPMSTYDKAMEAMKVPSTKLENTVKKSAEPVTKTNTGGKYGSKNSRKRN
jgi:hypothetical protein